MSSEQAVLFRSMEQLLHRGTVAGLDERALLERFRAHRDGQALAVLVAAHGPMVLGVCRRILREPQDVDDAFQSTFLVLVRKAGEIGDAGRLGAWLHGVARRVALRVRSQGRRGIGEAQGWVEAATQPGPGAADQAEHAELRRLIDEELGRLPTRYRDVVVLCDLEGRTYTEAAALLRCPLGTVQSRLARGRERLRAGLVRRGVGAAMGVGMLAEDARPAVPESLLRATIEKAAASSAGGVVGTILRTVVLGLITGTFLVASIGTLAFGNRQSDRPDPHPLVPRQEPKPEPAGRPDRERTIVLEVRDAQDNKPLPGAAVWYQASGGPSRVAAVGRTDAAGHYTITLAGDSITQLTVVVAAEGHVPTELRWGTEDVPESPVVGLERGVRIGGKVVDEQGKPIAGVRVLPRKYVKTGEEVAAAVTDAQGRWESDALTVAEAAEGKFVLLQFWLTHPDYVAAIPEISIEQARARSSVQTMKRGGSLSGKVAGPDGRPIARARVVADQNTGNGISAHTETDDTGQFRFGRCLDPQGSPVVLTVLAPGLAAHSRTLLAAADIPAQVVQLDERRPLRGRVVDSQGHPAAGAVVESTRFSGDGKFDWRGVTDAQGRFEWQEAPTTGTIRLDSRKPGFEYADARPFDASLRDVTFTMHRPLHLHGTVTDAATGRPIERFDLIAGWGPDRPGDRVEWLRSSAQHLGGGRYDLRGGLFPDQGYRRSIRIEAEGYLAAELTGFRDDAEDIAHDFKLRKALPLAGIVLGPDGRPLAGAKVSLSGSGNHAMILNGSLVTYIVPSEAIYTTTGKDGRYTFQPQDKPVAIVVVHDAGFAVRTPKELAGSTDVILAPWGRIEGVLKIGKQPAPKRKVSAWMINQGFSGRVDYDTLTDAAGRFVLERVTPGLMSVYRYVDTPDNRGWTPSNPAFVEVSPGQTARVEVGGIGRPVIGRLRVPRGLSLADFVLGQGDLSAVRPEPRKPDDFPDYTTEQILAWYDGFNKTAEGKAYQRAERKYAVDLHADGTFRIEDVPAGRYVLKLPFRSRIDQETEKLLAAAHADVTVPAIPGGRSDEPLDLGEIRLEVFRFRELKVGDPAPALTRNAADGRPIDLGALRGKFVLLNFWATYRQSSVADLAFLKEVHESFGRHPRFAMIGLSLDVEPDLPSRYSRRKGLAWEQRYLGLPDLPTPAAAFGVMYPPQVMLIGPDGRVVARDLKGPEIKQAVAAALSPKP